MSDKPKPEKPLKPPAPIPPVKKLPEFYYDARGKTYWLRLDSGEFLDLGSGDLKLHLRHAGLWDGKVDTGLNPVEIELIKAQSERYVHYAGPLGGYKIGLYTTPAGQRVLVTSQARPDVFESAKGKSKACPFIIGYLKELLGKEQMAIALYWLKVAVETLRKGEFRPGQMIALAGPSTCGKSFFQVLVTEVLGGRSSKGYKWMMGKTEFNEHLAEVEHIVIEDETSSTNTTARREFGSAIKQVTVNIEFPIHGKGKKMKTLPTYRRTTLSVNEEPENLAIIPPMDASLVDKIILFKCGVATLSNDYSENMRKLREELPFFITMLDKLFIPPEHEEKRFGVKAYQHSELMEALSAISPEVRLENLIDEILFPEDPEKANKIIHKAFEGSADALERRLRNTAFSHTVENLLKYSSACGVYLARLKQKNPARFDFDMKRGRKIWTIQPPK